MGELDDDGLARGEDGLARVRMASLDDDGLAWVRMA